MIDNTDSDLPIHQQNQEFAVEPVDMEVVCSKCEDLVVIGSKV